MKILLCASSDCTWHESELVSFSLVLYACRLPVNITLHRDSSLAEKLYKETLELKYLHNDANCRSTAEVKHFECIFFYSPDI